MACENHTCLNDFFLHHILDCISSAEKEDWRATRIRLQTPYFRSWSLRFNVLSALHLLSSHWPVSRYLWILRVKYTENMTRNDKKESYDVFICVSQFIIIFRRHILCITMSNKFKFLMSVKFYCSRINSIQINSIAQHGILHVWYYLVFCT